MPQTNTNYRAQSHNNLTWVDLENPPADVLAELEKTYDLHPVHIKESLQKIQHNRIERENHYLFLVLHIPVLTSRSKGTHVKQVGVFLGKNFLVTIRSGASPFITDVYETCSYDATQAKEYFRGSAYLLYQLIQSLLNEISDMTDEVNAELDDIDGIVFDRFSDGQRIGRLRQKIIRLSRIIGPKRVVLQDLSEQVDDFAKQDMAKYYANNTKLVNKLWEEIEEAKETVEVYKDADFTASTEQTNRILAILTLVFTFTIPITVAGTLYGMNVLIPGGIETGPWMFLGKYTTFIVIVFVSTLAALSMYWYFKRKKWF